MSDDVSIEKAWANHVDVLTPSFEALAGLIAKRYETEGSHAHKPRHAVPTQLPAIIAACFYASMRTEEQRPIRFQLLCADAERTRQTSSPTYHTEWDIGLFSESALTAESLRKLAPALNYQNSAILAWNGVNEPVVAGVVRFNKKRGPREPHQLGIFPIEKALRITVIGPGKLFFDDCEMLLGEFADGILTFPQALQIFSMRGGLYDTRIASLAAIAFSALPEDLKANEINPHAVHEWEELYKSTILSILLAMRRTKCGGTLIITENDDPLFCVSDPTNQFSSWFEAEKDGMPTVPVRMQKYFRTVQECKHETLMKNYGERNTNTALFFAPESFMELHRDYAEVLRAAQFTGRLTAADGAVILRPDLSVCAMGAKLKTGTLKPCKHLTMDLQMEMFRNKAELSALLPYTKPRGMRFKSALHSAGLDDESLVFIASADGPVSVLMSFQGDVILGEPISFAPVTLW